MLWRLHVINVLTTLTWIDVQWIDVRCSAGEIQAKLGQTPVYHCCPSCGVVPQGEDADNTCNEENISQSACSVVMFFYHFS
jgi:hypothetical protein